MYLDVVTTAIPDISSLKAVVFDKDGSMAGIYRKMHIPDDPGYYEKFYFTPGDLGFRPIETSIGKLGVLVCWDQWYPEAARLIGSRGDDAAVVGTSAPDSDTEQTRMSRWPSASTPQAISTAASSTWPAWRTFSYCASSTM